MKRIFLLALMVVSISLSNYATTPPDEGMWLPIFVERLNYTDMQEMGLNLTAEEIYSINNSSLKDAIVNFGNMCTAEVVSPEGLLLTNHHCGYDIIQTHSSIEHDYLTDGFWAMSRDEELTNDGLTATFFIRMEDITEKVLAEVTDEMSESDRKDAIKKISGIIEDEAAEDDKYDAQVRSFFNGNEYYLFVYETYRDVRLVGAPPSSIGKFGGDTDNWMWPRHTGDFSMFRVYTAPDGTPADYAEENIPLKAKYHIPISLKGVHKEDFAMIWGYPGGTDRYRTSYGIEQTLNETNPAIINLGDIALEIMKEDMDVDPVVKIQYSAKYFMISNLWKNKIGESRGLKRLKVSDKKNVIEDQFRLWVEADPAREEKYGSVMQDFADAYKIFSDAKSQQTLWYYQGPFFISQLMLFPLRAKGLEAILQNKDYTEEQLAPFYAQAEQHFKDYNPATEQKLYAAGLKMLYDYVPKEKQPDIFETVIIKKYKGDFDAFAADIFEKSIFANREKFEAFLSKPSAKKFEKDLANQTTQSFYAAFIARNAGLKEAKDKLKKARRLYVAGLREMMPDKVFYPDANFTMRLTYGEVLDYFPADAVHYDYVTHLSGVMEKEDPSNDEFIVSEKLVDLYNTKDYGRYGEDGKLIVCFLTNNDITGGNSGSPVINGDGELIGIAFDGNWEAMSGDIAFEPELQRTISVDIRYVLFVIDKYAGAQNLIDELTIHE